MVPVPNVMLPGSKKNNPAKGMINSVMILMIFNATSIKLADLTPLRLMMVTMPSKAISQAAKIVGDFMLMMGVK